MEEYRYDGTDFTKNKNPFPVWNIIKKLKWYIILEMLMRNIL